MKGTSYTYFTTENAKSARELIGILREAKAIVPPQLEEMSMYSGGGGGRGKYFLITSIRSLADIPLGRYGGGRGRGGRFSGGGGGGGGGHQDSGYGSRGDRW